DFGSISTRTALTGPPWRRTVCAVLKTGRGRERDGNSFWSAQRVISNTPSGDCAWTNGIRGICCGCPRRRRFHSVRLTILYSSLPTKRPLLRLPTNGPRKRRLLFLRQIRMSALGNHVHRRPRRLIQSPFSAICRFGEGCPGRTQISSALSERESGPS